MLHAAKPGDFLDLEIHINARQEHRYPAHIHTGGGQVFEGILAAAGMIPWVSTGNPTDDGCRLFAALFADPELRRAWEVTSGQSSRRRVRLWIAADTPELHALPWELLHDGQVFLAADAKTPFSRYLPSDLPLGDLVTERPIRVLTVISNPVDLAQYNLAPVDVAVEEALLAKALNELTPTHFVLEPLEAPVTLERLERALASGPHVLHIVGHGAFSERRGQATLYLQDANGNAQLVTDRQLCEILRRQAALPCLTFLAACQSAARSTIDAFAGLAPQLVQVGVPAVVAMQDQVELAATRQMTPVFYEELAQHGEVDRALNAARSNLFAAAQPDATAPVLFMRLRSGQLWEPLWVKTNPYRGLAAFTENEAPFFFGREQLITNLSDKVRRQRFIAVVGPSGSGKSSVVQAGLLPRLSQDWVVHKLRPGSDPDANGLWHIAHDECQMMSSEASPDRRFVLFVDQFEELFVLCPPEVQARFLDDLNGLIAGAVPATVIITLRADFYGHLQNSRLNKHLEHALVNVLPMQAEALRAAIEQPAQKVGLLFEAGLVETMIRDAQHARHTLPLLQFALTQLWERQTQGLLTYTAYQALGGVAGAIGLWAEDTYNAFAAAEQGLARRVFTRLVHYGEGDAADTRQRCPLPELLTHPDERDAVRRLLQRLADKRLLVTDEAQGIESVEIIHDALLKEWPRLEQWLTGQREFYLWRQRLDAQMQLWQDKGQDESALLRGAILSEAERWADEHPQELNREEQAFIQSGVAQRERERQAREAARQREMQYARDLVEEQRTRAEVQIRFTRRLRIALTVALVFLAATIGGFLWATAQTKRAREAEAWAHEESSRAQTAEVLAEQRATTLAARALALQSQTTHGDVSLLLALESIAILNEDANRPYPESIQALRQALGHWSHWQTNLCGHAGDILSLIFEAQDNVILSAGRDGKVLQWDRHTPNTPVERLEHPNSIRAIAIAHDAGLLAVGSDDGVIQLLRREADTGQYALVWQETLEHGIISLALSKNGAYLVVGSSNGLVGIWRIGATIEQIHQLGESIPKVWVRSVAISPDGRWLVAGADNGQLHLWEMRPGDSLTEPDWNKPYPQSVQAVTISRDSQWLALGSEDGALYLVDLHALEKPATIIRDARIASGIQTLDFSPVDNFLAVGVQNGALFIVNVDESRPELTLLGHISAAINIIRFSPSGAYLATGDDDACVRVWGRAPGRSEPATLVGHTSTVRGLAFLPHPDSDIDLVSVGEDRTVRLWATATTPSLQSTVTETNNALQTVDVSVDGHWLAAGGRSGEISLYAIHARDLRLVARRQIAADDFGVPAVAFSPDGAQLAIGAKDRQVYVWRVTALDEMTPLPKPHTGGILALAFSPQTGRFLAVGDTAGYVYVWDMHTQQRHHLYTHESWVRSVAISPDEQYVASVSEKGDLRLSLMPGAAGESPPPVQAHTGRARAVRFSLDGAILATAGDDGTIKLWDPANLQSPLEHIQAYSSNTIIYTLAFSPDGRHLASGGVGEEIKIWTVAPDDLRQLACARAARNLTAAEWETYLAGPLRQTCPR